MSSSKLYYLYQNGNGSYTTSYNAVKGLNDEQHFALVFDKNRHTIWAQGEEYGAGLAASKFNFAYSYGAPDVVSYLNNEGSGKARQFVTKVSYTLNSDKFEITYSYAYESSLSVGDNTGNFVTATSVNGHHITNSYGTFETTGHSQNSEQNYVITYAYINSAGKLHYDYRNISGSQDNDNGFVYGYAQTKDGKVTVKTKSFANSYTDNGSHNLKSYTSTTPLKNVTDAYIDKDGEIHMTYNTVYLTESEFTHHDLSITQNTYQGNANFVYAITGISTSNGNAASHTIAYQISGLPTKEYVDAQFKANDALRYCGTITGAANSGSIGTFSHTTSPGPGHSDPDYSAGAVYKVSSTGYFGTERVKAGDMIISYSDSATASSTTGWNVINQNIDLRQTPSSSTNGDNTKRVITNVNLTGDGELTYNYSDLSISNNTQTFSAASQITDAAAQNILVSGGSKGHQVITNVSLTQDGLQTKLDVSYTYLYSERKHHSGSVGTSGGTNGPKKFVYYTSLSEDGTLSGETASLSPSLSNTANSTTETTISVGGNTSSHTIQYASNAGTLDGTSKGGLFTDFSGGGISSDGNILTQTNHSITVGGTTLSAGSSTANIINSLSISSLSSANATNLSAKITVNGQESAAATISELYATYLSNTTIGGLFTSFSGGGISSDGNILTQANHSITVGGTTLSAGSSTANIINSASISLVNTGTFHSNDHYTEIALSININGVSASQTFNTTQLYVSRANNANNADALSGTTLGGLLTDVTLSTDTSDTNKTKVSITVGGTTKSSSHTIYWADMAGVVYGQYLSGKPGYGYGGQANPDYFGKNKVGFLMMNTTVNSNSQFKDWIIMDCYNANDVGGAVAFGVNRQSLGAFIMRSAATRTSWAESAELIGTHNYTDYTVQKDGTGATGTWGINITGDADTVDGEHSSAFLHLTGGTMSGYIGMGDNASKFRISQGSNGANSPLKGTKLPSTSSDWLGLFSRPGLSTDEGGILISEDTCVIYNSFDNGYGLKVINTDLSPNDWSSNNALVFGITENTYQVWSYGGFAKKDSSDDYILLGGGGHIAKSTFWSNSTTVNLTCTQSVNYSNTITVYSLMVSLSIGGVSDYSVVYDVCATFASVAGCLSYNNSFYNVGDLFNVFITQGSSIYLAENKYWGSGYYGLNCKNSDIVNVNGIFTNDYANDWTEGYCFKRSDSNYDSIWVDSSHALKFTVNGNISNTSSGTNYTVLHTGNINPRISITNSMVNTSASLSIAITCGGVSTNYQVNDLLATFAYTAHNADWASSAGSASTATNANNSTKWNNYSLVVTTNGSTSSMTSNNTIYMVI